MHPFTPQPRQLANAATKQVVFGSDRDLGMVLTSDDPLDQLRLRIDADGDGELGLSELQELLVAMGRVKRGDPATAATVRTLFAELDTDSSGEIDAVEFQVSCRPKLCLAFHEAPRLR